MLRSRTKLVLFSALFAASIWLVWNQAGFGLAGQQPAAPPAGTDNRKADRDAIKAMLDTFREAFQKKDAAAAAALMTAEAELIPDEGETLKGRDAIQKAYAIHFSTSKPRQMKLEPESLRFTSRDTAIEEGVMTVTREDEEPQSHRYHILYAREDGKWLISVIKEWPPESDGLGDLAWLIGTWTAKTGDVEVSNTYEWFGNKGFIKAAITVRGKEKTLTALQLIGRDPASGAIRTWTFESDGGLGEGSVTRDGPRWIFENVATLTGGAVLETTNILLPVDKNTITWQPINLAINGDTIGNLPPTKLTRVKK